MFVSKRLSTPFLNACRRRGSKGRGTHLESVNWIFSSLSLVNSKGVSAELSSVSWCLNTPARRAGVACSARAGVAAHAANSERLVWGVRARSEGSKAQQTKSSQAPCPRGSPHELSEHLWVQCLCGPRRLSTQEQSAAGSLLLPLTWRFR